jgi:NAD(P)-dependent dehydrogenase (short-subunit alcohol dehydrogenase family)
MLLEDKVAIVTGGNRGIGSATSRLLAREGAAVVVAARDARSAEAMVAEIVGEGGRAIHVATDVGRRDDVERMVGAAIDAFGGIDILVNNAGVDVGKPLLETSEAEWDWIVDTNLKGHWLCAIAVVPHMIERGGGAIVNTASVLAMSSLPNSGVYSASKAGILGLTRSMAIEWGPLGIRVNCILPGSTDTDMMWFGLRPDEIPAERKRVDEATPLGRVADPSEIAEATVWLCSSKASFATGSFLWLDGGSLALSPNPR